MALSDVLSPFRKALMSAGNAGDYTGETDSDSPNEGDDYSGIKTLGSRIGSRLSSKPDNRIEDEKSAGTRGTTPQGGDSDGPLTPGWNPQRAGATPPFVQSQPAQAPSSPSPYQSLSDQIASEQNEYGRMTAKPTLKQRILTSVRDAAMGFSNPELVQQERGREQQARENLAGRISADTRTLTQEQLADARMRQQAEIEAARRSEDWQKTQALIQGRSDVAGQQVAGRENVAGQQVAGRENVAGIQAGARDYAADKALEARETAARIAAANKSEPGSYLPVPAADGSIVGYINPKSRHFVSAQDIPQAGAAATGTPGAAIPAKPSGQTTSRMDQAQAIKRGGDNLIADLRARASHVGQWGNFWKSMVSGTPLADPDQNYLANQIMSFAALQPAAHGARGLQAIQSFEDSIGGTPTSLDALIAGIQGIQRGVGALIPPAPSRTPSAGGPTPFGQWNQSRGGPR